MGNTLHDKKTEIPFIEHIEESIFGPIDIYQNQEGVYIMQIQKTYVKDDINHKTMREITEYVLESGHSYIIPIVSIRTDDHHGICGISSTFVLRTDYYNFTLHDMIKNKKVFDEGELWLVFEAILSLILDLKNNNLTMKFEGNRIFLTLKGQPAISHLHIESNQNSLSFHFATMGQYLAKLMIELILSRIIPQEYLEQSNMEIKEDLSEVEKKYKKMHGFIKSLLFNTRKERDVLMEMGELIHSEKVKKATEIKLTKFKYLIPENTPKREELDYKKDIVSNTNKVTNAQLFRSVNEDNLFSTQSRDRKKTEYTDKSEKHNKEYNSSSSQFFMSQKTNIINLELSKLESSKLLGDFDKKKEQYRLQKQRFEQKRNELLHETQKQNIENSRPSMREFDSKKMKKKPKNQEMKRASTEMSHHSRYR